MKRTLSLLAATIAALLLTLAPASAGEECSGCSLLGSLSVNLSSIEPLEPMVGDVVTLTFDVDYALPGGFDCSFNGSCALVGGAPFLEGDEPPAFESGGVVVRRRAVQAGVATVQLDLTGETEEACRFEDESGCSTFFQPAFIHASTGPIELEVQEGPTPSATPTATPTFTPTARPRADDDGCAIGRSPHASTWAISLLLLPALLLALARLR